ncbi:MAG: YtxH domain-containing protein [Terriglobales bacterium]
MKRESSETAVIGFLIGASVGATLALLFAPATGERSRKALRRTVGEAGDYISSTAEQLAEKANELLSAADKILEKAKSSLA